MEIIQLKELQNLQLTVEDVTTLRTLIKKFRFAGDMSDIEAARRLVTMLQNAINEVDARTDSQPCEPRSIDFAWDAVRHK